MSMALENCAHLTIENFSLRPLCRCPKHGAGGLGLGEAAGNRVGAVTGDESGKTTRLSTAAGSLHNETLPMDCRAATTQPTDRPALHLAFV